MNYFLLYSFGDHEKIDKIDGIRQIGYITKESLGAYLITRDGNEFEIQAQGWVLNRN